VAWLESEETRAKRLRRRELDRLRRERETTDMQGLYIDNRKKTRLREHDRNRHATMTEPDIEQNPSRRREWERGGDGNIRATRSFSNCYYNAV